MATSSASLDQSPRSNWVEETEKKTGKGLPPGIRKVARKLKQLHPEWSLSRCIATAISRSKVWAAGGSAKGARNTAGWEALKGANKARMGGKGVSAAHPAYEGAVLQLAHAYGGDAVPSLSSQLLELAQPLDEVTGHLLDLAAPAAESAEGRRRAAAKGMALPGGSFPVPDVAHLKKAMKAYGRGTSPEKRAKVVALIRRAAKKLGVANEQWVRDWLSEHSGGTRKDEVAAAEPADDVSWLDLADKVTEESLRLARQRAKELGKEEKGGGSKKKFNAAAHPRAGAGSPTGGQFVPAGTARNSQAAQAQKDTKAADNSAKLQQGKVDPAKLTDDELQKLSRYVYSWKSSDPKVVAARVKVAAALRKRGMDPGKFGSLAGAKPTPKPKPTRKPKATPKPARTGTVAAAQRADLVQWLDLATERRVRTPAGVKRYNRPIGAVITAGSAPKVRRGADFVRSALKGRATRQQKTSAAADRLSGLDSTTRAGVLGKATPQQLAAMDTEFARRAEKLGKPGQVSKAHADVKAARGAARKPAAGKPAAPAADDRLAKLTPAQRDAVLAARAKRAQKQGQVASKAQGEAAFGKNPAEGSAERAAAVERFRQLGRPREATSAGKGGAAAERPTPDMSNPEKLSDAELDAKLADSKVRLRAAFENDPRRSGQAFADAKLYADVMASEKRRRNVAAGAKPLPPTPEERAQARLAGQQQHTAEAAQRRAAATPKPAPAPPKPSAKEAEDWLHGEGESQRVARAFGAYYAEKVEPGTALPTAKRQFDSDPAAREFYDRTDTSRAPASLEQARARQAGQQRRTERAAAAAETPAERNQRLLAAERAEEGRRTRELDVNQDRTDAQLDAMSEQDLERLQNRLLTTSHSLPNSEWQQRQRLQAQADRAGAARARKQQGASVTSLAERRTSTQQPTPAGQAFPTGPREADSVAPGMVIDTGDERVTIASVQRGKRSGTVDLVDTTGKAHTYGTGERARVVGGTRPDTTDALERPTPTSRAFPVGPREADNIAPGMQVDVGDRAPITVASVERGRQSGTVDLVDTTGKRHTFGTSERAHVVGGTRPGKGGAAGSGGSPDVDALLGMPSAGAQQAAVGRMSVDELRAVDDELTRRGSVSGARRAVAQRLAATVEDRRPLEALAADERAQGTRRTEALDIGAAINARQQAAPDLAAERKRVERHTQRYTSEQRATHAAAHTLGPRQRQATGENFYTHPDLPNSAFSTRDEAARAAVRAKAAQNPRAVPGTPENIAARQQARARGASQPSMFAGEEEQKMTDVAVRRQAAGTLFDEEPNDEAAAVAEMTRPRTASTRAAQAELQRARRNRNRRR